MHNALGSDTLYRKFNNVLSILRKLTTETTKCFSFLYFANRTCGCDPYNLLSSPARAPAVFGNLLLTYSFKYTLLRKL